MPLAATCTWTIRQWGRRRTWQRAGTRPLTHPACLAADTLRLVEGYVEVTPLGPVPVKGLSEPIEVYELLRAGPVRSRSGCRGAGPDALCGT